VVIVEGDRVRNLEGYLAELRQNIREEIAGFSGSIAG